MRAVEGSLLVVDSTQGVEAQTLANVYQAIDADHEIVPILNKIDLPASDCDRVATQIEDVIGIDASGAIQVSAKTGQGIPEVLEAIVTDLPAPKGTRAAPLKAMLVDSWYDAYLGVIVLVRIVDGVLKKADRIRMMSTNAVHPVDRLGVFKPQMQDIAELGPGEIGFLTASIKQVRDTRVGDTITTEKGGTTDALPGFKPAQPVVFCGLFPVDNAEFEDLREAIEKLQLNDASFSSETETSAALGFGFRCGFLGLLHLEVIRDRIEREYHIDLITTAPSVIYRVHMRSGEIIDLHNPADMPDMTHVDHIEEPRIKATILVPDEYLGDVLKLCQDRRGIQVDLTYAGSRAMVVYDLPLNEVVFDFYDRLKSVTKGYASFDYALTGHREDFLVKMQILVNEEPVDALSMMVHPRPRRSPRAGHGREAERTDPPPHVQNPDPGRDRRPRHRPRDPVGDAQGRNGEMLWGGCHAQAQAVGQTKGREKEDAPVRESGYTSGGLYQCVEDGVKKRNAGSLGLTNRVSPGIKDQIYL